MKGKERGGHRNGFLGEKLKEGGGRRRKGKKEKKRKGGIGFSFRL